MKNLLDKTQYALILHRAEMRDMLSTCTFLFINYEDVHSSSPLSSSSLSRIYLLFLTWHHFYPNSCAYWCLQMVFFPLTTCDGNRLPPSLHFKPSVIVNDLTIHSSTNSSCTMPYWRTEDGKSSESVQCTMLKACDACADMGQL